MTSYLTYALLLSSLAGCSTFHIPFEKKMPKATAADPAVQILCLWQQGEGRDPKDKPCKGFVGQILFLSNKANTPVEIDGEVRIYLFDDQGTEEEQTKPLHQFNFDAGSWAVHLAETSLGPTYTVFVPYVRSGIKDANCALRVRLKPKRGPTIFSEISNIPLNVNKKPVMGEEAKPISPEETDQMAADALAAKLRRTTTISLGSNTKTTESLVGGKKATNTTTTPKNSSGNTSANMNTNQVRQASHEVVSEAPPQNANRENAPAESEDAERIRRLEAMVQQLLEQKANPAPAPVPVPSSPPRQIVDRLGLDDASPDETRPPGRLKWKPKPATKQNGTADNDSANVTAASKKHPLDD